MMKNWHFGTRLFWYPFGFLQPPPRARQGFGGPSYLRHPTGGGPGWGATGLRHTRNCRKSRNGGVATPWRATWGRGGGVVASAPLSEIPHNSKSAHFWALVGIVRLWDVLM